MPLPSDLATVTVTGHFAAPDGEPLRGKVTFSPSEALTDSTGHVVLDGAETYNLSGGSFTSATLASTDNAGLSPQGWSYLVSVALQDSEPAVYSLLIPHTPSPVDLSALIAAQAS